MARRMRPPLPGPACSDVAASVGGSARSATRGSDVRGYAQQAPQASRQPGKTAHRRRGGQPRRRPRDCAAAHRQRTAKTPRWRRSHRKTLRPAARRAQPDGLAGDLGLCIPSRTVLTGRRIQISQGTAPDAAKSSLRGRTGRTQAWVPVKASTDLHKKCNSFALISQPIFFHKQRPTFRTLRTSRMRDALNNDLKAAMKIRG